MSAPSHRKSGGRRVLRLVARVVGTATAVIFLLIMALQIGLGEEPPSAEGVILGGLTVSAVIGVALAWRWEHLGGALTLLVGAWLCVFAFITAGHNHLLAMLISGAPYVVIGVLFLAAGWRCQDS